MLLEDPKLLKTDIKNNIINMKVEEIPISEIKQFTEIPDFISPYNLPQPVVIKKDGKYMVIGGSEKIQVFPGMLETVRCLELVLSDNSLRSIAIEKVALFVRPAGGTASYAEIVRSVAFLIALITDSADGKMVTGHGGSRRGKDFETAESLHRILADRLGKSLSTAKNYIYFGKNLSADALEELAKNKAGRKFFEDILIMKNEFTESISGKSPEEITEAVSGQVIEWWNEFNLNKTIETNLQSKENVEQHQEHEVQVSAVTGNQTTEHKEAPAGQKTVKPLTVGATANISPVLEENEVESEEENDVISETFMPSLSAITNGMGNNQFPDIYENIKQIANTMIEISDEKPAMVELKHRIQDVMAEISALLGHVSETGNAQSVDNIKGGN